MRWTGSSLSDANKGFTPCGLTGVLKYPTDHEVLRPQKVLGKKNQNRSAGAAQQLVAKGVAHITAEQAIFGRVSCQVKMLVFVGEDEPLPDQSALVPGPGFWRMP